MTRTLDITAIRRASEQKGLVLPDNMLPGRIVRFPGIGKTNGNKSGWAWLSEDGAAAAFGDWATGLSETWQAARSNAMTPTEQAAHTRRIAELRRVRANPQLLEADKDAEYAAVIEIDLADLKEPVLCCPNDPDDAKLLSQVAGTKIDEVFIGSCMTNIGHFRAASKLLEGQRDIPVKLWIAPPTKMDAAELTKEGHYGVFGTAGARTEMPGCSLCMGNQAQVREGATVVSTSTRNFPNRLGKNANVYLASAELAAIASKLGRIPTVAEYQADMGVINADGSKIYKYMNFDQIEEYADAARGVAA